MLYTRLYAQTGKMNKRGYAAGSHNMAANI